MKKLLLSFFIFLLFVPVLANENMDNNMLKTILLSINKYWQHESLSSIELNGYTIPTNEKEKIQLHLKLVHQKLSNRNGEMLSAEQKSNRTKVLKILKSYYEVGNFPINLHHSYRTPYFIDVFGTACAVGHLIIESGHPSISQMIAETNNYAYIEEMNYSEVEQWASTYGFTMSELKWIQPGYAPYCAPGTHQDPECHNGPGCINPDFAADSLIPPYNVTYEYNDGSGWIIDSIGFIHVYGARIGQHRITCIDSLNTRRVYNYTINNVPDIDIQASITHQTDSTNCNASLNVQLSHGTPPYRIELQRQNPNGWWLDSSGQFNNLCSGNYTIVVYDNNYCQNAENIQIYNLATSLEEKKLKTLNLSPNPFKSNFKISFESSISFEYRIYRLNGQLVQEGRKVSNEKIDLNSVDNGVYFIEVRHGNQRYTEKIVKAQ